MPAFLSEVKSEIRETFAKTYEELSDVVPEDLLSTAMTAFEKKLWTIVERRLKESFTNGKQSAKEPTKVGEPTRRERANPFRRE